MCINCSDYIDRCDQHDTNWQVAGNPQVNGKPKGVWYFYAGDKYCEHLKEKYGHKTATFEDRYGEL